MRVRALHDREIKLVVDLAGKHDAVEIEVLANLGQHSLLPCAAARGWRAVAEAVAAHHDDANVLAGALELHRGAHHRMEPAIGLEVARDVGHELLFRTYRLAADLELAPVRLRVRLADVDIDALAQQ